MKKSMISIVLVFILVMLSSCASRKDTFTGLTVTVMDGEHYETEISSVSVQPGESAAFLIKAEQGYMVTGADYPGDYGITLSQGFYRLEVRDVQYPVRIRLTLSHYAYSIVYHANGGDPVNGAGDPVTRSYDVRTHTRPNVSIGTDMFRREGHTLTCWNTEADGSGERIGLGSRMSVSEDMILYAQWAEWTPEEQFAFEIREGNAVITAYTGSASEIVIPETLGGRTVTAIEADAFRNCRAESVIFPKTLVRIEENAFRDARLREITFYDNIEYITDDCFAGCQVLATLHINAIEDPFGYSFRRESILADKFDLLINTMGEKRLLFYGGCSMWFNLISEDIQGAFGEQYTIVNMAINGVMDSLMQMEIMSRFVTENDVLIHTPEISSNQQLLNYIELSEHDDKLWCALEYNYDLVSLVDIRVFDGGVLESLRLYLDKKKPGGTYSDIYTDSNGNSYWDEIGCVPFLREESKETLSDNVELDPAYLEDLSRLEAEYGLFREKNIPIYVTFACIDIDNVPEEQRGNVNRMGELFLEKFSAMEGVTAFGNIRDFLYHDTDCYDTVYHLLTVPAKHCTGIWIRDLKEQFQKDGLWTE